MFALALIAATGPRGMRLAATCAESWVTVDSRDAGAAQIARLEEACASVDRDPASVGRLALIGFQGRPLASLGAFQQEAGRYAALGFTDLVVHWPRAEEPFTGDADVLEQVAALLGRGELP